MGHRKGGVILGAGLMLLAAGCDQGLKPPDEPTPAPGVLAGTVRFVNWDSAGTVTDLRLVVFASFPPGDIIQEVLEGRATVYPPLGGGALAVPGTDAVSYALNLAPGTYPYIAVAQQFGPDVMRDWRAVGQYDLDTNLAVPSSITIISGTRLDSIDILVDFENLPPPPFLQ
jgi:hypothetical protein